MTYTVAAPVDTRECHLYRFWVRHPLTGERVLGYIGETVRQPFTRLMEHIDAQPWADTIVGWEVDTVVYAGKDAVLAAEAAAIRAERPLYNYRENLDNPLRVEIWRAKEQRWARDAVKGRPRWVPPKDRPEAVPEPRSVTRPVQRPLLSGTVVQPWQVKVGWWAGTWSAVTALFWLWLDRHAVLGAHGPQWHGVLAAVLCAGLLVWAVWRIPLTRRQWLARRRAWWRAVRRWWR